MAHKSPEERRREAEQRKLEYQSLTVEERLRRALARGNPESREVKRLLNEMVDQERALAMLREAEKKQTT